MDVTRMIPDKINFTPIITDHIRTLRRARETRTSIGDICLFFVMPLVAGACLATFGMPIPDRCVDFGLVFFSIVTPLIVNVLFLIYDIKDRRSNQPKREDARDARLHAKSQVLLEEVYKNLSYASLMSLATVLSLGATKLIGTPAPTVFSEQLVTETRQPAIWCVYFVAYFLLFHIGLTALMIVKRVHVLLAGDFAEHDGMG